jgi:N-acetylmuramoyl-L-alanine amidase
MTIKYLVIHCSDSPDDRDVDAEEIHRWHKERGWDGIGYHYVIKRNGITENGRPVYWTGAHVSGHNHHSIGICLIGRNDFADVQMEALKKLLYALKFKNQDARICGHYELDDRKTCPNFAVGSWLEDNMPGVQQ